MIEMTHGKPSYIVIIVFQIKTIGNARGFHVLQGSSQAQANLLTQLVFSIQILYGICVLLSFHKQQFIELILSNETLWTWNNGRAPSGNMLGCEKSGYGMVSVEACLQAPAPAGKEAYFLLRLQFSFSCDLLQNLDSS